QQRVAALAAQQGARAARPRSAAGARPRLWTPWRIGLGLAGATALALVAVGMAPMWVAAQVLRRAEAAAGQVENAHAVTWRVGPDGKRIKISEQWEQGRRWRIWDLDGQRMSLLTGGKLWVYEPKLNKVTVRNFALSHAPSGYTLTQMTHDYT